MRPSKLRRASLVAQADRVVSSLAEDRPALPGSPALEVQEVQQSLILLLWPPLPHRLLRRPSTGRMIFPTALASKSS